jgi:hypothetical protein
MDCHERVKTALDWYAGHQGNWQPVVRLLDEFFLRDPQRVIPVFETWPQSYHYPAMIYLRLECGVEVYEEPTEDRKSHNVVIRLMKDGPRVTIVPLHKRDLAREEANIKRWMEEPPTPRAERIPKRPHFLC